MQAKLFFFHPFLSCQLAKWKQNSPVIGNSLDFFLFVFLYFWASLCLKKKIGLRLIGLLPLCLYQFTSQQVPGLLFF